MFSVTIDNSKIFFDFLNSSDLDYVDVFLNDEVSTLAMNTSDYICVLLLPTTHTPNEHARSFRISRNLLKQQKLAETIAVKFNDASGEVTTSFMTGNSLLCNASFINQKVYSTAYDDKLALLRGYKKSYGFKLESIMPLIKLCNTLNGVLNFDSGIVSGIFANGIRVYKKTNFDSSLSMTPKSAQILKKCNDDIFSVENYVGAFNGNFAILINKLRVVPNTEYFSLGTARTQYRAVIDFSNLISFSCSHPMKISNFTIDLDERNCTVVEGDITYSLPIVFDEEIRAKADLIHEIVIPFSIMRNFLPTFGYNKVTIEKKQFFTCITAGDYKIMFN